MMSKDKPAYPIPSENMREFGITKRELFAMHNTAALLANPEMTNWKTIGTADHKTLIEHAGAEIADTLLKALGSTDDPLTESMFGGEVPGFNPYLGMVDE